VIFLYEKLIFVRDFAFRRQSTFLFGDTYYFLREVIIGDKTWVVLAVNFELFLSIWLWFVIY
jgi:hypothetical protein